MSVPVKRIS